MNNGDLAIKTSTIVRTVILVLALINQVLSAMGKPVIPISDELVEQTVTCIITVVVALWAWWKNNSFTLAARKGDEMMTAVRAAEKREKEKK